MNRREFNKRFGSGLLAMSTSSLAGVSQTGCLSNERYNTVAADTWRHSAKRVRGPELQKELIRYATLAANSHNTQPWRFRIAPRRIDVLADFSRRCPVVDPDDHHLYVSLGCATENLVLAANAHGLDARVTFNGADIEVDLDMGNLVESPRFTAIPLRQCTRAEYNGAPVKNPDLEQLESASKGDGVTPLIYVDKHHLEAILEYVVAGNTAQVRDSAFVQELKEWLRFSESSILSRRDGLYAASTGNPTMPQWVGELAFGLLFTEGRENEKYRAHIRSSSGIIAFVSAKNDKAHWIAVGRAYQRFALQSTAMGLKHAFINQAVEVPQVRGQLATYLGVGERRPDLLIRFGYGPTLPRSLRRPVEHVIV